MEGSCKTAISKKVSKWYTNMNREDLTGLVLLYLHKAFDIVNHDLLLRKPKLYRLSDRNAYMLVYIIFDREKHYVQINQNN